MPRKAFRFISGTLKIKSKKTLTGLTERKFFAIV